MPTSCNQNIWGYKEAIIKLGTHEGKLAQVNYIIPTTNNSIQYTINMDFFSLLKYLYMNACCVSIITNSPL